MFIDASTLLLHCKWSRQERTMTQRLKVLAHFSFSRVQTSQFLHEKSYFCTHLSHTNQHLDLTQRKKKITGKQIYSHLNFGHHQIWTWSNNSGIFIINIYCQQWIVKFVSFLSVLLLFFFVVAVVVLFLFL